MTTAQVIETSVTVTNSSFQNYTHPDDHISQTTDTPGFKPFTMELFSCMTIVDASLAQQKLLKPTTSVKPVLSGPLRESFNVQ